MTADAMPIVTPLSAGSTVRNDTSEFAVLDVEEMKAPNRTMPK